MNTHDIPFIRLHLISPFLDRKAAELEIARDKPSVITTNFSDTEIKLGEADFFLKLIEQNASHQAILYYGLSAFLAAARSITLYLQAEGSGREGFESWYESVKNRLKSDEVAKFLKDTRDKALHARYSRIKTVFDIPLYKDGKSWVHRPNDPIYSGFSFLDHVLENGLIKCQEFMRLTDPVAK